ncbi:uncharacterized protein LOC123261670 isoform X1 [Cotesia glomerata]|uniref:Uncharacterized protein n=1 Tax=Cotesia glomerata TaxID=32391 RepID=A0AAV7IFK6_COTGL|nr:uncharacterized protein LOC123261670 isoform X1 [Cotesia glomerata]KAH0550438.1 hypothetical protein KQX54_019387 [Cotesia glomerata]
MMFFTFVLFMVIQIFNIKDIIADDQFYTVNITRDFFKPYTNNLIKSTDVLTKDTYISFIESMDSDNALTILKANISIKDIQIWDSKTKNAMNNLCNSSYPAGSIEENVSKIVSATVLGHLECPVSKGTYQTVLYKLDQQTLHFNKPIPCGDYVMDVTLDTADFKRVFDFTFSWTIPLAMNCEKDPSIIK